MTKEHKASYNCNIIQQEKDQWFLVVKEYEMRSQKHIYPYLSGKKRINAINCDDYRYDPQECRLDARLFSSFAYDAHDHVPMQSEMYTHQCETPIGAKHVQSSCQ